MKNKKSLRHLLIVIFFFIGYFLIISLLSCGSGGDNPRGINLEGPPDFAILKCKEVWDYQAHGMQLMFICKLPDGSVKYIEVKPYIYEEFIPGDTLKDILFNY